MGGDFGEEWGGEGDGKSADGEVDEGEDLTAEFVRADGRLMDEEMRQELEKELHGDNTEEAEDWEYEDELEAVGVSLSEAIGKVDDRQLAVELLDSGKDGMGGNAGRDGRVGQDAGDATGGTNERAQEGNASQGEAAKTIVGSPAVAVDSGTAASLQLPRSETRHAHDQAADIAA